MAIVVRDRHGTYTATRKKNGPKLDRRTARYFAVFHNVWSKGFLTRPEADAHERTMKGQADAGLKLERGRLTLAAFIDSVWWPGIESKVILGDIKETTATAYALQIKTHIRPRLGDRKLRDMKPTDLQRFYATLKTERKLSTKSLRNIHAILSNIFRVAEADGFIPRNPAKADRVRPGVRGERSPEQKSLTPEQVKTFLTAAEVDRLAAAWRLATVTGMRRGEVLGLMWSDIDLKQGRVRVERAYVQSPDSTMQWNTPKTERGKRVVTIDAKTIAALRTHRKEQAAERLEAGELWNDDDIVFADELGQPIRPATFSNRFTRVLDAAGLDHVRLHDLRHTAVTLSLKAGEDIHVAARRFGHSPEVMLTTYAHVLRDQHEASAERIAAVFDT
jgi:integrase